MSISVITLILASGAIIINDVSRFRDEMSEDLTVLAQIIGTNSAAAIAFDNSADAEEILSALSSQNHIRAARIYTSDGALFAEYGTEAVRHAPESYFGGSKFQFKRNRLDLFHEIILDDQKVGTVYIQSDLKELNSALTQYLVIIAVVLTLSILAAFFLTALLQKVISRPILDLAQTVEIVSNEQDFSVRANKQSEDEIGFLTERFNDMLTQIQERDTALQNAHSEVGKQAEKLRRELHERTRVEAALRQSEEKLLDLFDHAPDTYMILDPDGIIISINKNGTIELGYKLEAIAGKSLLELAAPDDQSRLESALRRIRVAGEVPKNIESRLITQSGDELWVSIEFSLLRGEDGQLQSIRIICRDMTERKKLRQALERARRLESAGKIAGQIAHDFNNLLGPLAAYPKLVKEDLPADHPVIEMLDEMENAAEKIAEINQQLLSLGRRGHYNMEPMDLNLLVEKVILSQRLSHAVEVRNELSEELMMIKGGSAQLMRVFYNLITNAAEAMKFKGTLTIRSTNLYLENPMPGYEKVEPGQYVRIDIIDSGNGMSSQVIDKIFDPFFTTKTMDRMRGSGLGLSIVHGVVEDHQGYITVESFVGKGTTFSLYFPATRDVVTEVEEVDETVIGGNESILIVDDDPMQRKVTIQLLKRLGYQANSVISGEQAIEFVRNNPQDLLILDMAMDGMDGAETFRQIRDFHPEQKAIVLSGFAMTKRVEEAINLGAGKFISKPISYVHLAKAVRDELDGVVVVPK